MRTFRQFLEDDERWSHEEVMDNIQSKNAELHLPFELPDNLQVDPDDFYNQGGVFSFTYSDRMVKKGTEYKPEGLEIAEPGLAHRYMIQKNSVKYKDTSPILSGRYGIIKGVPILAIWGTMTQPLLKPALKAIWYQGLIHPDSYLFSYNGNEGLVKDQFKPRIPSNKKVEAEQEVEVGSRKYKLYELPGYLHSLSPSSQERLAIAQFICSNHEKYPFLKNFLAKAGCGISRSNKTPEWQRRRQYWQTSEGTNG